MKLNRKWRKIIAAGVGLILGWIVSGWYYS